MITLNSKNNLYFLLLLVVLFSALACRSDKLDSRLEVKFWTLQLSPYFDDYFRDVIARFEKENPGIRIKHVDIPYDAAIQKLLAAAAAGTPPDIINLSADFLAKFEALDVLADLSQFESADTLNQAFLENALDECIYEGKIIALPWYLNTYCVIYNKKLLAEAGYDSLSVPQTFDEFTLFIRDYKDKTGKYAAFWNIGRDSYLPMLLGSEGLPMTDSLMQQVLFHTSPAYEKLNGWIALVKEGYLSRDCVFKPGSAIVEPYQSSQVAMIFTGPVFLKRIKDNAPTVYGQTGVAPPLTGKTGKHELAAMTLSVLNQSEHKREAYKFLRYILNSRNQLQFCKLAPVFPSVKEALGDIYFRESDGSPEGIARVMGAAHLPQAVRLRNYLRNPRFDMLRNIFDESVQIAALTGTDSRTALAKAAEKWNVILREK